MTQKIYERWHQKLHRCTHKSRVRKKKQTQSPNEHPVTAADILGWFNGLFRTWVTEVAELTLPVSSNTPFCTWITERCLPLVAHTDDRNSASRLNFPFLFVFDSVSQLVALDTAISVLKTDVQNLFSHTSKPHNRHNCHGIIRHCRPTKLSTKRLASPTRVSL